MDSLFPPPVIPRTGGLLPLPALFFVTQEANGHTAFGANLSVCVFPSFSVSGYSDTLLARRDARIVRLFHLSGPYRTIFVPCQRGSLWHRGGTLVPGWELV